MFVSTCGFGSTGSSAVNDYLLECNNTVGFDAVEFTIATSVDGLEDLEFHLIKQNSRLSSSIYAIQRFRKMMYSRAREWSKCTSITEKQVRELTDYYIDSIAQLKFVGFTPMIDKPHNEFIRHYFGESIIMHRAVPYLEKKKIIKDNVDFYPLGEVIASVRPSKFYELSKELVVNLLKSMGCDWQKNQYLVMDQAFVGNDPAKSFPFFEDPFAIVVDRDPRDVYIFAKKFLLHRGRFMPTDSVENFITYYKLLRDGQPYKEPNERVLFVQFEDMVYNYEETTERIDSFLSVKNTKRQTIFIPEMSAANTNLIRKYPEFKSDITKIEQELEMYCYHFDGVSVDFDTSGDMFWGKSPLNK